MSSELNRQNSIPTEWIAILAFVGLPVVCLVCFFVGGIVLIMYLALIRPVQVSPDPPIPIPTASVRPTITPTPTPEPTFTPTPDPRSRRLDVWTVLTPQEVTYAALVYPGAQPATDFEVRLPATDEDSLTVTSVEDFGATHAAVDDQVDGDFEIIQVSPERNLSVPDGYFGLLYSFDIELITIPQGDRVRLLIPLDPGGDFDTWTIALVLPPGTFKGNIMQLPGRELDVDEWEITYFRVPDNTELDVLRIDVNLAFYSELRGDPPNIETVEANR